MHGRTRRYLISMGIRTVCLILAIFAVHGWLRLIFLAAAITLPWFAVVLANAGPLQNDEEPEFVGGAGRQLGVGSETATDDASSGDSADARNADGLIDDVPLRDNASSETMAARHHGAS